MVNEACAFVMCHAGLKLEATRALSNAKLSAALLLGSSTVLFCWPVTMARGGNARPWQHYAPAVCIVGKSTRLLLYLYSEANGSGLDSCAHTPAYKQRIRIAFRYTSYKSSILRAAGVAYSLLT